LSTAGLLSLRLERVDPLGAYRIPPETGLLIPSEKVVFPGNRLSRTIYPLAAPITDLIAEIQRVLRI
jgi:hypothetical protein